MVFLGKGVQRCSPPFKESTSDHLHEHVDDVPTDDWDQRPEAPDINPSAASRIWEDP